MFKRLAARRPVIVSGLATIALLLLLETGALRAQPSDSYPSKLIRIVVAVAPGGMSDVVARGIAQYLTQSLKQNVIVENRPGGNMQLGVAAVAGAPADGYTLLLVPDGAIVLNPHLYSKLSNDPLKDLEPVSGIAQLDQVLVVNPNFPVSNAKELIQYIEARPNQVSFGTFGPGSPSHLYMAALEHAAKIKFVPVLYRGAGPMLADVVANHIPMTFVSLGQALPLHREGKLRIVAVGSKHRSELLPEIPTLADIGIEDVTATVWFGLFAPAGTPPSIVSKLNDEMQKMSRDSDFQAKVFAPSYLRPMASSVQEFDAAIKSESEKWRILTKTLNLRIDQ